MPISARPSQKHGYDLGGARLVQHEIDLGEFLLERGDDLGQRVAGLRVCRGHRELSAVAIGELLAQLLDVLRVEQNAFDDANEFLPRLGQAEQPLSFADEEFDTEFILQVLDVLGDT